MEFNLNSFKPISLKNTNSVKLMDRKEFKYVLSDRDLDTVLDKIKDNYYILEIDKKRSMEYESTYFDDNNFSLFTAHENGKLNRYKIRIRKYLETNQSFLEVKFKNNKKRTIKNRVEYKTDGLEHYDNFIVKNIPFKYRELEEKLTTKFERFTLVSKNLDERVTVDRSLRFSHGKDRFRCKNLSIIEVKFESNNRSSNIVSVLDKYRFRPYSFSKYWFGVAINYSEIKKNRLKEKLKYLYKHIDGFKVSRRAA